MKNKEPFDLELINRNLCILRSSEGWNKTEFAFKLGIERYNLRRLETGKTVWTLPLMLRCTHLFGKSLDEIFLLKLEPNSTKNTYVQKEVITHA